MMGLQLWFGETSLGQAGRRDRMAGQPTRSPPTMDSLGDEIWPREYHDFSDLGTGAREAHGWFRGPFCVLNTI